MYALTLPDARPRALPLRWGQVTLRQSARLAELPEDADTYSVLAVLLALSPLEVMNLPADFVNEQVLSTLDFMATGEVADFSTQPLPASLTLPTAAGERQLVVPKDITASLTFGQATDLGSVLQDASLSVHEKRQRLLAILFYRAYHEGLYDSDGVAGFARDVCSQAALEQALPITDFFLLSSTASAAPTSPSSSPSPLAVMSERPDSKSWWRNGIPWLWSTRWPLATKPSGPTSGA